MKLVLSIGTSPPHVGIAPLRPSLLILDEGQDPFGFLMKDHVSGGWSIVLPPSCADVKLVPAPEGVGIFVGKVPSFLADLHAAKLRAVHAVEMGGFGAFGERYRVN